MGGHNIKRWEPASGQWRGRHRAEPTGQTRAAGDVDPITAGRRRTAGRGQGRTEEQGQVARWRGAGWMCWLGRSWGSSRQQVSVTLEGRGCRERCSRAPHPDRTRSTSQGAAGRGLGRLAPRAITGHTDGAADQTGTEANHSCWPSCCVETDWACPLPAPGARAAPPWGPTWLAAAGRTRSRGPRASMEAMLIPKSGPQVSTLLGWAPAPCYQPARAPSSSTQT